MKVEVDKISQQPLELTEEFLASEWELDREDLDFTGLIHLAATFKRSVASIDVEALTRVEGKIICSRCLKEVVKNFQYNFSKRYDLEVLGDYLEINSDVREEILLGFPMKVLCAPGCKGLCQNCGRDLNTGQCNCR